MILRLFKLIFRPPSDGTGRRLLLFGLCGALAFVTGFVAVSPALAERLIVHGGYYYMLGVFLGFAFFLWRLVAPRRARWMGWLRRPGMAGLVLAGATVFALWADPFKHKILYDEYVLQGTAWHMHATKEVSTPVRAYDFSGTWLAIDTFLDKRPYFFAFLLSLVHDLSGFREANAFALNAALTPICLGLVYWFTRQLTRGRGPAFFAVGLLAMLPLFAQNVSGAGMELHNLTMIVLMMAIGLLYLRSPDDERLSLFVLGIVLLAQSRYESVLFVAPAAVVIVLGWLRAGRVLLPWPAIFAPLLLVPYAWQSRVVDAKPILWQLREGETARFAFSYLKGNLEGALRFFFGTSPEYSNSWWLTVVGIAGIGWGMIRAWHRFRVREKRQVPVNPAVVVLIAFGAAITANIALLMFYYWSHLDEPIASRFALPSYLLLALLAGWLVGDLELRRLYAMRAATLGLAVWVLGWGAPAYARRLYTSQNLLMRELDWDFEQIAAQRGPLLLITNKATIPFLLKRVPVVNIPLSRGRGSAIAWHLREGTFREALVVQAIRPTSAAGDLGVDPDDVLPAGFHLQTIAEKRFGLRWDRISRLVKIDPEPAVDSELPPAPKLARASERPKPLLQ